MEFYKVLRKIKIESKYVGCILIYSLLFFSCDFSNNKPSNLTRVETAHFENDASLLKLLSQKGIQKENLNIFLRAFKKEEKLEVWAKNKSDSKFQKLITYDFCKSSGILGPKRKEGDLQIPEGLYYIDRFNHRSKFYLSLGLNYPNKSDQIRGDKQKPGSDIFIHGACSTVGCIPITDDKIKELWVLAEWAKENGQKSIEVHIFPANLSKGQFEKLIKDHTTQADFWKELQTFYLAFETSKSVPSHVINNKGQYKLNEE